MPDVASQGVVDEGYSGRRAAEIVGITYRQLDYWARTDLIRPSLVDASGSGSRRRYSYRDLLELKVVKNLLHNAIQYNRPDGAIDMAVGSLNGELRIEVRDTGVGISPEAKQRIFERFFREDPSRHAEGLHAGLGLAIVKGYVDLMGGKIDVESTVGQGSTFRLRLPAQAAGAHG